MMRSANRRRCGVEAGGHLGGVVPIAHGVDVQLVALVRLFQKLPHAGPQLRPHLQVVTWAF